MKNRFFNKISRRTWGEWIAPLLIALTVGTAPSTVLAQDAFPDRSLSIVVAFGTGGVSDITARVIADPLGKALGQRVLVKNMPGSSGAVASQYVLQAGNDGYTLLNMGNAATIRATLMPNFEPDQLREFQPVSPIAKFGLVVVTAPNSEIDSIGDLVNKANKNPGSVNIGTVASGSTQNLSARLFKSVADIDAAIIPYKSTPELMAAVARGDVDIVVEITAGALSAIKNEQVRAIATTMAHRSKVLPDVPTVEEEGVKPFDVSSWSSYVVPNGAPGYVIAKLNSEIQRVLKMPDIRKKLLAYGIEPFIGGPDAVDKRIEEDVAKWRDVINEAGMPIQN